MLTLSKRVEIINQAAMTLSWLAVLVFAFTHWLDIQSEAAAGDNVARSDRDFELSAYSADNPACFSMKPDGSCGNRVSTPDKIEPGSYGKMTYYVLPDKDGDMSLSFDINLDYELADEALYDTVDNLTKGHIMFFLNKSGEFYSDRILYDDASCSFRFEKVLRQCRKGVKEPIDIYWVWAYKAEQVVMSASEPYSQYKPLLGEADIQEVVEDIRSHSSRYFLSDDVDTDLDSYNSVAAVNRAWDYADDYIGKNVLSLKLYLNADGFTER